MFRPTTRLRIAAATVAILLGWLFAPAARATSLCAAGPLTNVAGTTCDIGNLEYTFDTDTTSFLTQELLPNPYPASDFTFTPSGNGFVISGPVVSVTGASTYYIEAAAYLGYSVTALGTSTITGISVSCGPLVVNGYCSNTLSLSGVDLISTQYNLTPATPDNCIPACGTSGTGEITIFDLQAPAGGGTAEWDPSTSVIVDSAGGTPVNGVPEPATLLLCGAGLAGLGVRARKANRLLSR